LHIPFDIFGNSGGALGDKRDGLQQSGRGYRPVSAAPHDLSDDLANPFRRNAELGSDRLERSPPETVKTTVPGHNASFLIAAQQAQ
jgi:hypothetical protein